MPGLFTYAGQNQIGYPDYRDTGTGRMLVADPGGSYDIAAIDGTAAVPPPDGRWANSSSSGFEPPPPVPPVPEVPDVPPLPESGDE